MAGSVVIFRSQKGVCEQKGWVTVANSSSILLYITKLY